jgi:xylulokinase
MMYLGIDCGTQSLRVLAWQPELSRFKSASRSYGLIAGLPPGHKEQDPRVWIDALDECILELKSTGLRLSEVRAVGVSGQQHGLVVLDREDEVIRPAKLWNDTSTEFQCREIVESAGGIEAYRKETGNSLPPGFTASKILWIRQNEPKAYQRISSILLPHDYLNFYLTGEKVAEAGDASGTGYFKVREREWSSSTLTWIDPDRDLSRCLPKLIRSSDAAGALRPALAEEWGMSSGVLVSAGGGDNMMGAIGSGNVGAGLLTVSLGTSGTLYSYSAEPVIDPLGEIAAFCDSTGGWLPLGCTMNVTVATEMIRNGFLGVDHSGFDRAVESVTPGCEGLIMVPYLEGERMPSVPNGCGVLLGLRPGAATPSHLARAAMEGVTMGLRYGLERLRNLGLSLTETRLIGGGARSPVWRQIAADVFDVPVACPVIEEGPAFGAALQAMWAVEDSEIDQLAAEHVAIDEATMTEALPENVERYEELYQFYELSSRTLIESDVFHAHRALIEDR